MVGCQWSRKRIDDRASQGKLIHKQPGQAIVECAGVGYDVTISVPTFTALPSVGGEAALYIHTQVSEDQPSRCSALCSATRSGCSSG